MTARLPVFLKWLLLCALALSGLMPLGVQAGPSSQEIQRLPSTKRSLLDLYLYASEVPSFLASRKGTAIFIDVRAVHEVQCHGTPALADANIPFEYASKFVLPWGEVELSVQYEGSSGFAAKVAELAATKGLGKNAAVVLISNHGETSAMAANMLAWHGYTLVYSVIDGYEGDFVADRNVRNNGWIGNHLPVTSTAK